MRALPAELRVADGRGQGVHEDLGVGRDAARGQQRALPAQPVELHEQVVLGGGAEERVRALQPGAARPPRQRLEAEDGALLQPHDRLVGGDHALAQDDVLQPLADQDLLGAPGVRGVVQGVGQRAPHDALGMDERVVHRHRVAHLDRRRGLDVREGGAGEVGGEGGHQPRAHQLEVRHRGRVAAPPLAVEEQDELQAAGLVEGQQVVGAEVLAPLLAHDLEQPPAHLRVGVGAVLVLDHRPCCEASRTMMPRLPRSASSPASSGTRSW